MEAYFSLAMKSIFVENILLAYFLGMCSFLACAKKVETATGLGLAVIFVLTVTAPLNWALNEFLLKDTGLLGVDLQFLSFIVFIATIAATVQLVEMVLDRFSPALYNALGIFLPLIAVNCSILGTSLFMQEREYGLDQTIVFGFSSGIGWALAIVAMAAAFERILEIPSARPVLVATGALTNVALLFSVYPELAGAVEVVLMGGALGKGNTGPVAEFNIQCDPEAARIVFESGANLTMVPLEVTHTALVTPEVRERLLGNPATSGRSPSRFRRLVDELMRFFADTYKEVFDFEDPPLHDPCAVAYAVAPEMFETRDLRVDVECGSELCAGQTVVDWWRQSPEKPINCRVCVKMDVGKFWDAMCEAVDNANVACPLRD